MSQLITDLTGLHGSLANSDAFQTWCGADDETEAADHIAYFATDKDDVFPMAILSHAAGWNRECINGSAFYTSPEMLLEFVEVVDKDDANKQVFASLLGDIDSIMADVEAQNLTGYAALSWKPDSENTPGRAKASAHTDYVSMRIILGGYQRG
jgi:hypothetical protein